MSGHILRDWFQDGQGIRREVISADIQSFLGNDATVRPGVSKVGKQEVKGYWIRAYRNLTSKMVEDLREKSAKWDQESQRSGRRGSLHLRDAHGHLNPNTGIVNYQESRTFQETTPRHAAGNNSPRSDIPYAPTTRSHAGYPEMQTQMDTRPDMRQDPYRNQQMPPALPVSTPYGEPAAYAHQGRQLPPGYAHQGEYHVPIPGYHDAGNVSQARPPGQYPPGQYPPGQYPPGYPGREDYGQPMQVDDPRYPGYQGPREDHRYAQSREDQRYSNRGDPRYPPAREDARHRMDIDESRYPDVRGDPRYMAAQGDPRYQNLNARDDTRYQPQGRGDDPRYQAAYQEGPSRYPYPSPAISNGAVPGRDPDGSSPQAASYSAGAAVQYDQYGRPLVAPQAAQAPLLEQSFTPSTRPESSSIRERPSAGAGTSGSEPRRRRLH